MAFRGCFARDSGKQQIDILPGQNVLKIIQDRFESCVDDITTYSPSLTHCSTPIDISQKENEKILQKSSGLLDLVTKGFTDSPSLAPSPVKTTDSTEQSLATLQKSAILKDTDSSETKERVVEEKSSHDNDIVDTKDLVASSKQDDVLEGVETTSQNPADTSEDEDIDVTMGSPLLLEEAKMSPVRLHTEIKSSEVSHAMEENQVAPMERVKCLTVPSEQKVEKNFSSALLASMITETIEKSYSAPVLPPAATPVKELDLEIEHDCEFLIDESEEDSLISWFSVRRKKKQTEETKNDENRKKSAKTPNQKNTTDLKQKDQTFTVSLVESSTNTNYRTREDSSGSSDTASHSSDQAFSSKENRHFQNYYQSISKKAPHLSHKKQTDKQKLSEVKSSKKLGDKKNKVRKPAQKATGRRLRVQVSEESSVNQSEEEMNESELLQSDEVVIPSLQQESLTSASQKSLKLNPKHGLNSLGSFDGVCIKSPAKFQESLQNLIDSTPNAGGGKRESAKSPRKASHKRTQKTNQIVCSGPEDTETSYAAGPEDSSLQSMAQQKCRKVDASVKTKKDQKKRNVHRSQSSSVSEETMHHHSGPVQTQYIKHTSKNDEPIACELDSSSSDTFVESDLTIRRSLRHKIVKPSNTPNVRRTKRTRLKPLEYWRGERVNYMSRPSGGFVIAGVVRPVSPEKVKRKRNHHIQKTKHDRVEDLDISLADASKPTAVWDPAVNGEVLLECISTGHNHSYFFKDESVEIYKHLNTSVFATGKLILKPLKEKGYQFIHMDKIAFHVVHGRVIFTLHETSYRLSTGDFFYVPAGNAYNIRNLLNEDSILIFTQLKGERPIIRESF
ncbi:PREDICTED: centromere protein C [Gavialis gangeticus]|uniref:centromere protein C n=1 Tax=Gavialis gangeticus TaxID=94835 RepID=UPI00092E945A|nr:PREDICTED: centromere protein C [Gavialis gangeticus]